MSSRYFRAKKGQQKMTNESSRIGKTQLKVPAPRPVDRQVLERQVALNQGFSSQEKANESRKALLEGRKISLPPHGEVELGNPIDWFSNPLGQRNWAAQLQMLRWLRPISASNTFINRSDADAQCLLEFVESWAEAAFPVETSPQYTWSDMVDAVRAFELMSVLVNVPESGEALVESILYFHGEWLSDEANLGHSNHAVWQHIALFVLGKLFGRVEWSTVGKQRLEAAFQREYDAQGINREAAPGYHLYNYRLWSDVQARMLAEHDLIPGMTEVLNAARAALIQFTDPNGNLIELGDTGPKTHLKSLAGTDDIKYVLTKGAEGHLPPSTSSVYNAGYILARSGWGENERDYQDEFFMSLRFGKIGVHGHNDIGSLLLFAAGEKLLIDGGKYGYISDDNKRYVIGRSAHNTLVVPGARELSDVKYDLISSESSASVDDFVIKGIPYQGIQHTRRAVYVRGADVIVVLDTVSSRQRHQYELNWHLNPEAVVNTDGRRSDISIGSKRFAVVSLGTAPRVRLDQGVREPSMSGWYSPRWGELKPTPTLIHSKEGDRLRFITVIGVNESDTFEAEFLANTGTGVLLTTRHGYFAVDADQFPATVRMSRGEKPLLVDETQGLNTVARELERTHRINGSLKDDPIALKLRDRLESISKLDAADSSFYLTILERAKNAPTKDFGLRAALIDYLGYMLSDNPGLYSRVMSLGINFRDAVPSSGFQRKRGSQKAIDAEQYKGELLQGFSVFDEHLLTWSGKQGSNVLLVRFNGAVDRSRTKLPYFGGLGSMSSRNESVLVFSDPAFDRNSDMRLGWYLGEVRGGRSLYDCINEVISEYVSEWGIEKVVLFGSSGGGFASLQVGLRRGNCSVLVINPQTILKNYLTLHYERAVQSAFRKPADADASLIDARLLLASDTASSVKIHYVDNEEGDVLHHKQHFLPFKDAAEGSGVALRHLAVDLGKGHRPMAVAEVDEILDAIVLEHPAGLHNPRV